jgi:hypothetical protein
VASLLVTRAGEQLSEALEAVELDSGMNALMWGACQWRGGGRKRMCVA